MAIIFYTHLSTIGDLVPRCVRHDTRIQLLDSPWVHVNIRKLLQRFWFSISKEEISDRYTIPEFTDASFYLL